MCVCKLKVLHSNAFRVLIKDAQVLANARSIHLMCVYVCMRENMTKGRKMHAHLHTQNVGKAQLELLISIIGRLQRGCGNASVEIYRRAGALNDVHEQQKNNAKCTKMHAPSKARNQCIWSSAFDGWVIFALKRV